MSPQGEWTDADDQAAIRFASEAVADSPDIATAAAVLATASFAVLADRLGPQEALSIFRTIVEEVRLRFSN